MPASTLSLGDGIFLVAGGLFVGATLIPDFCRYARNSRHAVIACVLAFFLRDLPAPDRIQPERNPGTGCLFMRGTGVCGASMANKTPGLSVVIFDSTSPHNILQAARIRALPDAGRHVGR